MYTKIYHLTVIRKTFLLGILYIFRDTNIGDISRQRIYLLVKKYNLNARFYFVIEMFNLSSFRARFLHLLIDVRTDSNGI